MKFIWKYIDRFLLQKISEKVDLLKKNHVNLKIIFLYKLSFNKVFVDLSVCSDRSEYSGGVRGPGYISYGTIQVKGEHRLTGKKQAYRKL